MATSISLIISRGVRVVLLEVLDAAGGRLVLVGLGRLARTAFRRGLRPSVLGTGQEALQELLVVLGPLAHRQLGDLHLTGRKPAREARGVVKIADDLFCGDTRRRFVHGPCIDVAQAGG